jgi:serine/threonine-protein kinase
LHSQIDLLLCASVAILFIGFSFYSLKPFESLEKVLYDVQMRLDLPGNQGDNKIAIVNIDEKSLRQIGPWPWPRHVIAEMLSILKESGTKLIGLSFVIADKEHNEGLQEMKGLQQAIIEKSSPFPPESWLLESIQQAEKRLDNDQILVEAVKSCGNVILAVQGEFGKYDSESVLIPGSFLEKNSLRPEFLKVEQGELAPVNKLKTPFSELGEASLAVGHSNLSMDPNSRGYLHLPFINYQGHIIPSQAFRLALEYLGKHPEEAFIAGQGIRLQDEIIPIFKGEILIKFKGSSGSFPNYSFVDILSVKKVPAVFNNKIVLIGYTADETTSIVTPVDPRMPPVELMANAIEGFLNGRYLTRPNRTVYIEAALLLLFALGCSFLLPNLNPLNRLGAVAGFIVLTFCIALSAFAFLNIWFKTVYIILGLAGVYTAFEVKSFIQKQHSLDLYSKENIETNRMFGLSLQSQGLLDLAFEKFRKCPLDDSMKDIIYNLGLDYERKRMVNKAVSVYEYITQKDKNFRDLQERIPKIKTLLTSLALRQTMTKEDKILMSDVLEVKPTVGRYEILGEIGQGAMGIVYKARDPQLQRLVAIKTIRFADDFEERKVKEIKTRFLREAEIAGKLSHPSIVSIYDAGEDYDLTYLAMEFVDGENLVKYTQRKSLLPLKRVLYIIGEAALAIDYAHTQGVIHRDIKPGNIMILKNGKVKVTDFGVAKAVSSSQTRSGIILGTPNYMSPEQINGQELDGRSDIFSLGVVLFELLTGQLPFRGKTLTNLFYKITQVRHASVSELNPQIPKICEQILDKAMAKDAGQRFQRANDLARYTKILISKLEPSRSIPK